MSKLNTLKPNYVELIPQDPGEGILYISEKYKTAVHLCCCGCGNKVVTPLKPGGWTVTKSKDRVSLHPSIGNWSFPCQSHYWIRKNRIDWAGKWSQEQIDAGRLRDQRDKEKYFEARQARNLVSRVVLWIKKLFRMR